VQHSGRLPYTDQAGAISEHLADAFAIMPRQYAAGETATQSNWLIGAGLFGPGIQGIAIRSMLIPGTAYDDKWLCRDPQPGHMHDYVDSPEDNGGVHVNSGIPNRAFALAARALGGYAWEILGRIWYRVLTSKLTPETTFLSFARDTVKVAGELYPHAPRVQHIVAGAWRLELWDRGTGTSSRSGRRPATGRQHAAGETVTQSNGRTFVRSFRCAGPRHATRSRTLRPVLRLRDSPGASRTRT
jgi:Zn-dependent metalloprotease